MSWAALAVRERRSQKCSLRARARTDGAPARGVVHPGPVVDDRGQLRVHRDDHDREHEDAVLAQARRHAARAVDLRAGARECLCVSLRAPRCGWAGREVCCKPKAAPQEIRQGKSGGRKARASVECDPAMTAARMSAAWSSAVSSHPAIAGMSKYTLRWPAVARLHCCFRNLHIPTFCNPNAQPPLPSAQALSRPRQGQHRNAHRRKHQSTRPRARRTLAVEEREAGAVALVEVAVEPADDEGGARGEHHVEQRHVKVVVDGLAAAFLRGA